MADNIHVVLSPKVAESPTKELTLSFETPENADDVLVQLFEVDSWGSGPSRVEETGGRDTLIAELKGKIVNKKFLLGTKDPKGKLGAKPNILLRIDGENNPPQVHVLPIPESALANEQGIYEIEVRVSGQIKKKKISGRTPVPVFLRNFKGAKPIIAFITGSGDQFFENAGVFWKEMADGKFSLGSIEEIRNSLDPLSKNRQFGNWGDVNIINHGNEFEWIVKLFKNDQGVSHVHTNDLRKARSDPRLGSPVGSSVDEKTRIIIRGCAIGNDQALLDEIRQLFGGKVTVLAPKFIQTYRVTTVTSGGKSVKTPRESFFEMFFFYLPGSNAPGNEECKRRLKAKFPKVSDADWIPMLTRPQKTGNLSDKEEEEQLKGFRHDRTETFNAGRFTFTFTHPKGKPSSNKEGQFVDFLDMARQSWKNDEAHFDTDFDEWDWTQGPLQRRELDAVTTVFSKIIKGQRHRVEVRREFRDANGVAVRPDLDNPDHYGRSAPSAGP